MRLPMLSRNVARSYSGGGYDSRSGTSSSEDEASSNRQRQSAGESAQQRIARRKQKRKGKRSSATGRGVSSVLGGDKSPLRPGMWLILVAGLVFCLVDVLYILKLVSDDRHANSSKNGNNNNNNNIMIPPQSASKDDAWKTRPVQHLESDWETETGQEPIARLLKEATGTDDIDPELLARIPSAGEVAALYGRAPVVLGLETCQRFQHETGDPAEHFVSTAGSFNTGTNLMAELLIANCHIPARVKKYGASSRGVRWQVLWGKHTPVFDEAFRQHHRTYNDSTLEARNMFPAVTVRDPFKWAQSMCRHSYGASWPHDKKHCPNLVPNEVDRKMLHDHPSRWGEAFVANDGRSVNVTVKYAAFDQHHNSLLEFWNDWYRDYVRAPFPRLIVRFEDVVFHPKLVTQTICECAGGEMNSNKPFKYIVDSAKKGAAHGAEGQKTSYVDALVKYGTEAGRYNGFEAADLEYAKQHLDPDLMRLFGYKFPSDAAESATTT